MGLALAYRRVVRGGRGVIRVRGYARRLAHRGAVNAKPPRAAGAAGACGHMSTSGQPYNTMAIQGCQFGAYITTAGTECQQVQTGIRAAVEDECVSARDG